MAKQKISLTAEQASSLLEKYNSLLQDPPILKEALISIKDDLPLKADNTKDPHDVITEQYNNISRPESMDKFKDFIEEVGKLNFYEEYSIRTVKNSPNHIIFQAQLLYPYWENELSGKAVRSTMIHLIKSTSDSSWKVILLSENDRFTSTAKHVINPDGSIRNPSESDQEEDIVAEQRYYKNINIIEVEEIKDEQNIDDVVAKVWHAFWRCYPNDKLKPVANGAKKIFEDKVRKVFTQRSNREFDYFDYSAPYTQEMLFSRQRAQELAEGLEAQKPAEGLEAQKPAEGLEAQKVAGGLDISQDVDTVTDDGNLRKTVKFGKSNEIIIEKISDSEVIMYGKSYIFNCFFNGVVVLNKDNKNNWGSIIKENWLFQQCAIQLGDEFNPGKLNTTNKYKANLEFPMKIILEKTNELFNFELAKPKNHDPVSLKFLNIIVGLVAGAFVFSSLFIVGAASAPVIAVASIACAFIGSYASSRIHTDNTISSNDKVKVKVEAEAEAEEKGKGLTKEQGDRTVFIGIRSEERQRNR